MENAAPYDAFSDAYADLVRQDPLKRFVQYPWAIEQLENRVQGSHILDVGCGEGALSRMLARMGARISGYDISGAQIESARSIEAADPLGIVYIHADQFTILGKTPMATSDFAVAVAVLHYASDRKELAAFFSSTLQLLHPGGQFAALVCNPDFRRFDQRIYNRRFSREDDGRLRVDFFDDVRLLCSADYTDFSKADYESAATTAGWATFEWRPVRVTTEGKEKLGDFWKGFEEDCPYAGLVVRKPVA